MTNTVSPAAIIREMDVEEIKAELEQMNIISGQRELTDDEWDMFLLLQTQYTQLIR